MPRSTAPRRPAGEDDAYQAIGDALLNGRLRPGAPLRERQLATIFAVSRGCIRKVLHRLGHEGRLDLLHNRGAFVPRPSLAEAQAIYEARRALEAGIAAVLASQITGAQLAELRSHVASEHRAAASGRRGDAVRLAGGFHILTADLLGNAELAQSVRKLVSRTQLMVSLYEPRVAWSCGAEEHEKILAALDRRDAPAAMQAMLEHLALVEQRVTAARNEADWLDVEEAFGDVAARAGRGARGALRRAS